MRSYKHDNIHSSVETQTHALTHILFSAFAPVEVCVTLYSPSIGLSRLISGVSALCFCP